MKELLTQIIKFGFVGGLCFLIDFVITMVVYQILKIAIPISAASTIGGFFGFTVSVVVNYLLSMKFVFERKEDMSRKKEFTIFVILSIIGLGINELVIWFCTSVIYSGSQTLQNVISDTLCVAVAKVIATAIVMVYNFVTRKIFLEKK